jgi:hypothetical protein
VSIGYEVDVAILVTVVTPRLRGILQPDLPSLELVREAGRTKWRASVRVVNKGNIHERVEGRVDILDLDLRRVAEAPLATGKGYVLPDGTREFQAEGSSGLRDGTYTVRVRLGRKGENARLTAVRVVCLADGRVTAGDPSPQALASARLALGEFCVESPNVGIKCAPGARTFAQIRVRNRSAEAVRLAPRLLRWSVDRTGKLVISSKAGGRDASSWVAVAPQAITLPPKGTGSVRLSVAPPRGLVGGEYYAAVLFARPDEELPTDPSLLSDRAGLVTIGVGNQVSPKVVVSDVSVRPRPPSGFVFSYTLTNNGNGRAWPTASISVTDARGERVEPTADVKESEWPLMPGTSRDYRVEWDRLLAPGSYTATAMVETTGHKELASARITFEATNAGELDAHAAGTVKKRG